MPTPHHEDTGISGEIERLPLAARWFFWLVPHKHASPRSEYNWRLVMALTLIVTFFLSAGDLAVEYNHLPFVQSGFAQAHDVADMRAQMQQFAKQDDMKLVAKRVDAIDERLMESQLLDLRIKHCKAHTPEARQLYWDLISKQMLAYLRLTGVAYQLPSCSDL